MPNKQNKRQIVLQDITRGYYSRVINLKPPKYRLIFSLFAGVLLVLIIMVVSFLGWGGRAEYAKFYPQKCLGNWINVSSAEGFPELDIKVGFDDYSGVKAALFDGGSKQIFCGSFAGKIPAHAKYKEATLKIVWAKSKKREIISPKINDVVIEKIVETPGESSASSTPTTTESFSGKTDDELDKDLEIVPDEAITTTTEEAEVEEKQEATTTDILLEEENSNEQSWLNSFITTAWAQTDKYLTTATSTETTTDVFKIKPVDLNATTEVLSIAETSTVSTSETKTAAVTATTTATTTTTTTATTTVDLSATSSESIGVTSTEPNFIDAFPENKEKNTVPDKDLFVIKYSLDGYFWQELATVSEQQFDKEFILPLTSLVDISNLQISIESLAGAVDNTVVLLDGMYVEVTYEGGTQEVLDISQLDAIPRQKVNLNAMLQGKKDFRIDEDVQFVIPLDELPAYVVSSTTATSAILYTNEVEENINASTTVSTSTPIDNIDMPDDTDSKDILISTSTATTAETAQSRLDLNYVTSEKQTFWQAIKKLMRNLPVFAQTAGFQVINSRVINGQGKLMQLTPQISESGGNMVVSIPKPARSFNPGKYQLQMEFMVGDSVYDAVQDFSWGVLAVNTNKSVFNPGEKVYLQMAVLNERGHTVCQAPVKLEITDPGGSVTTLSSDNGGVFFNETCGTNNVTDSPDYYAFYQVGAVGQYQIRFTNLKNNYEITDTFEVKNKVPVSIERIGATRINPFLSSYEMTIKLKFCDNFSGYIIEKLPSSFDVLATSASQRRFDNAKVTAAADEKLITWSGDAKQGDEVVLTYTYQAPYVSPQFYLLGKIEMSESQNWFANLLNFSPNLFFSEARSWQIASDAKANGLAWVTGTQTTNSTNFNQATAYEMDWSAADVDSDYFTWEAGTSTRLYVDKAGDYLLAVTVPMQRTDANAKRSRVETTVFVNGTKVEGALSRSSYIRLSSSHNESSNHIYFLLKDLSAGDYITVKQSSAPGNDMTGASYPTIASGQVSMLAEYVSTSTRTVFFATSTQTTAGTNLNQATAAALEWAEIRKDTGFTHSDVTSPADITLAEAGNYAVYVNIPWGDPTNTVNDRNNIFGRVTLDGYNIPYALFSQGYVRGDSNSANGYDYDGSLHFAGIIIATTTNQVLNVTVQQEAGTDNMTVDGEQASIYIEKISTSAKLFAAQGTQVRTNLDDWNQSTKSAIEWETEDIIDSSVYTHSTTTNPHQIQVNEAGDYIIMVNTPFTSAVQRSNVRVTVEVDGVEQTGANTKSNYIRSSNNHSDGSNSLVYLLENLSANQVITVSAQAEAASGTVNDSAPASVVIWKKDAVGVAMAQRHYRWRDDTTALNTDGGWLATEDNNPSSIAKQTPYRLRFMVANSGTEDQSVAKTYELQYGNKNGVANCNLVSSWTGVGDLPTDEFAMVDSTYISPDGASTTASLLTSDNFSFTNGQAMDSLDTTDGIGPMASSTYTEIEYSFQATEQAVTGYTYCFRLYHINSDTSLDEYLEYPEATIESVSLGNIIGEYGTINLTNNATTTVNLSGNYNNVVVVATAEYAPSTDAARSPRITATTTNSFDIKVDNYAASLSGNTTVDWFAIESGAWTLDDGGSGTKVIADSVYTTAQAYNGGDFTSGTVVNFSPTFNSAPAVIHTVGSNYDTAWTASMVNDGTRTGEPTANSMKIMMMTSFDTSAHSGEYINYVAFDPGYGTHQSVDFDAVVSADGIVACCSTAGYGVPWDTSAFSTAPEVTLSSQMGEDGGNGGFASTHTGTAGTASTYYATIDEDGPGADRSHTQEVIAHVGFDASSGYIKTSSLALDQTTYRFYQNIDAVQPTTPAAATNTALTNVNNSDIFRIRMTVQAGLDDMATSSYAFTLQWGEATSTCASIINWTDVDSVGGSGIWRGYDNASVADGATTTASLLNNLDNALETYEEQNNSATNTSTIIDGGRGEWDWVVQNNNATSSTTYCFRMVTTDDSVINYSQYPQVTTAGSGSLTAQIVDGSGSPVANPSVSLATSTLAYNCSSSTGVFGTSTEKIRVENTTGSAQWTLTMAANTSSDTWTTGSVYYDFNDSGGTPAGCADSGDSDGYGGQMTVDPSGSSITPETGCTTTGLSYGSLAVFNEGSVDNITLLTAGATADTGCYWDLEGIGIEQTLPPEQIPGNYTIDMVITITAS